MSRLIDADKIDFNEVFGGQSDFAKDTRGAAQSLIDAQPTVEAVPKSYAEQIRWERDVAVRQLNEIGCQFGQKMDEVKKKLEATSLVKCKDCKYSDLPAVLTRKYGKIGTLTCHNRYSPCNNRNVNENDFCSYGEMRTSAE